MRRPSNFNQFIWENHARIKSRHLHSGVWVFHLASPCSCGPRQGPCGATCAAPPAFSPPWRDWEPTGSPCGTSSRFCSPPSQSTCSARGCDAQSSSIHQEPSKVEAEGGREKVKGPSIELHVPGTELLPRILNKTTTLFKALGLTTAPI